MSMTTGQIIKPTDITSVIYTKVSNYLPKKNPGGSTTFNGNRTTILNNVRNTYAKFNELKNQTIHAEDVRNCVLSCMYEACHCGLQQYQVYAYHTYTNTLTWPSVVNSAKYRGMYADNIVGSLEKYIDRSTKAGKKAIEMLEAEVKPGNVIRALNLTEILDNFIEYNISLETTKNLGLKDTCYSSCHSNCHGSSRSRR